MLREGPYESLGPDKIRLSDRSEENACCSGDREEYNRWPAVENCRVADKNGRDGDLCGEEHADAVAEVFKASQLSIVGALKNIELEYLFTLRKEIDQDADAAIFGDRVLPDGR